ncbi:uncharacterized protein LOC132547631 [Ylistrum balloti]|uniref:uncharacterized protein LOC132547631 n=1 Tax=Ylistrum balloti TaxID=509963 RepID=UPI002905F7A8|nr:uncharacterized protein LOC132547631 [Ylistrum balloti]
MERVATWKTSMEEKRFGVNMNKTKVIILGPNLDTLRRSGKYPCAVCLNSMGRNSILCMSCSSWVCKKCSGIKGSFKSDPNYKYPHCNGLARPIDGRPMPEVKVGEVKLEVLTYFCYCGDMLSSGDGCELAVTTRCKSLWEKFRELLRMLTSKYLPITTRGRLYSTYIRPMLLYGSDTWAVTAATLKRFRCNDRVMLRWICLVKPKDNVPIEFLLDQLDIKDISEILQTSRLRWFDHVECSKGWISNMCTLNVTCHRAFG